MKLRHVHTETHADRIKYLEKELEEEHIRNRIRQAGLNPQSLEQAYIKYKDALVDYSYAAEMIENYENSQKPKWENFIESD